MTILNSSLMNLTPIVDLSGKICLQKDVFEKNISVAELFFENIFPMISIRSLHERIISLKVLNSFLKIIEKIELKKFDWLKQNLFCPSCFLDSLETLSTVSTEAQTLKEKVLVFEKKEAGLIFPLSILASGLDHKNGLMFHEKYLLMMADPLDF